MQKAEKNATTENNTLQLLNAKQKEKVHNCQELYQQYLLAAYLLMKMKLVQKPKEQLDSFQQYSNFAVMVYLK